MTRAAEETCQDRVLVLETPPVVVVAVADGAGGTSGGAQAAQFAIEQVELRARGNLPLKDSSTWAIAIADIDSALSQCRNGGQTTLVIVALDSSGSLAGASVGDSGAWVIGASGHVDLSERQRRKPLLGTGEAIPTPFHQPCIEGTLLIATDGLLKYSRPTDLCAAATDPNLDRAAERLMTLVRLPSGSFQDDVGLALVRPLT